MINATSYVDNYIDLLMNSSLFYGLSADEIEIFLKNNHYEIITIKIFEELSINSDKAIIILSGAVATYEFDKNGKKTFINYFTPESNSLVPIKEKDVFPSVSIIAKKTSVVLLLNADSFMNINPSLLVIQNKIQQNLINIFYTISDNELTRNLCNTEPQARNRILKFITDLYKQQQKSQLKLSITRDELADYLQVDTSTLMRELKKLKNDGIINYDRSNITILNLNIFSQVT